MSPYRIILVDDHTIFRAGLKSLIDKEPLFRVVGQAKDGQDLMDQLPSMKCDLVILDLSMPELSGIAALKQIKEKCPKVKVLILTMQKDLEHFKCAMANGASGYLFKDDAYDQLFAAIRSIQKGKSFVAPSVGEIFTERFIRAWDETDTPVLDILSKREQEILKCVAHGLSSKNIAAKLKISARTVEAHRGHITNKLGIKTTAGLVRFAIAKGLA